MQNDGIEKELFKMILLDLKIFNTAQYKTNSCWILK